MAAALRFAVDDFLVGQHRAQRRAPVDRHLGLIGQPLAVAVSAHGGVALLSALPAGIGNSLMGRPLLLLGVVPGVEELQEDPLRPAEIVGIGGVDFAVPVVAEAEHLDLPAEGVDVLLRGEARMRAGLDGVLLGGQAEGVPAHRVQHVEAAHALVAGQDVGGGVAFGMADVQAGAAGIGEHVEDVELRLVGDVGRAEGLVLSPELLPARLDDLGSCNSAWLPKPGCDRRLQKQVQLSGGQKGRQRRRGCRLDTSACPGFANLLFPLDRCPEDHNNTG